MQLSSLVLLSPSCSSYTCAPRTQLPDTQLGTFLVLLECHWCGALVVAGETILWSAILPWQWRVCISYRRISYLLEIYNKTNAPVPAWAGVSVDGVCALCSGASKDSC